MSSSAAVQVEGWSKRDTRHRVHIHKHRLRDGGLRETSELSRSSQCRIRRLRSVRKQRGHSAECRHRAQTVRLACVAQQLHRLPHSGHLRHRHRVLSWQHRVASVLSAGAIRVLHTVQPGSHWTQERCVQTGVLNSG